jgi:hypothetical protein
MVPIYRGVHRMIPIRATAQILRAFELPEELTVIDKHSR